MRLANRQGFPDFAITIEDIVAEEDKVSEMYWNYDVFKLLQQLGGILTPGQQPAGMSA